MKGVGYSGGKIARVNGYEITQGKIVVDRVGSEWVQCGEYDGATLEFCRNCEKKGTVSVIGCRRFDPNNKKTYATRRSAFRGQHRSTIVHQTQAALHCPAAPPETPRVGALPLQICAND